MGWAAGRWLSEAYGVSDLRAYGRTTWVLTGGWLLLGMGRGAVAPVQTIFLVQERDIPLAALGLAYGVEFLVRALVGPVAGTLSDRYGRKPLMVVGLVATSLLLPAFLLVQTPAQLLVVSVLNGLLAVHSLYGPSASALVVDVVPRERRGGVFGLVHAARNLGWTFGIALGALLVGAAGLWTVFILGGLIPLLYLFPVLTMVHDVPRDPAAASAPAFAGWGRLMRARLFLAYVALSTVLYLGWGQVNTLFPLFLTDGLGLPDAAVGILAVNTFLIFLFQVPFGRLADRAPRAALLAWSALVLGGGYLVYAYALVWADVVPPLLMVTLGLVLFTLAEMLYSPILSTYAAELAPPGLTGSALGVLGLAASVGQGAPPFLADLLVTQTALGWEWVWIAMALPCLPSALGLLWLGRRHGQEARKKA